MPAYFGIDIGSSSIKVIKSEGKKITLIAVANNQSGKKIMSMSNMEKIALVDQIKQMLKASGFRDKKVVASIPESLVFSRVLKFPIMSSPELATAIKWELDQSVPFPPNEVETSWTVLEKPNKVKGDEKISVYVVAVPTTVSDSYVQLFELLGIDLVRLENEIPSLTRAFSATLSNDNPSIIVDIGASGIGLVTAGKDKIFSNYYLPYGGVVLTKLISDAFVLSIPQAESYKRTYGMEKDQLEGKMFEVLKPVIDNLVGEINKMKISYQNDYKDKGVSRVILTGGGSYLLGLIPYMTEALGNTEVVFGDVFSGLSVDQRYKNLGPVFSISCGLAIEAHD